MEIELFAENRGIPTADFPSQIQWSLIIDLYMFVRERARLDSGMFT
jgi:hypothetical protein